ncbi:RNA exonuclease 1 homolog [Thrips palmi]|uniref:RNA exonuclease 1 homolog n=1 Tax=Thrips palmi TaxID=161013 RepID=A0A6P8ZMF4_THRPL|nr:RNA exonuclease 1 homolog [Thrips palmi]
MLPSLGCFRTLECPFYNGGAGQCSRPYCHYRHGKRDVNATTEDNVLGSVANTAQEQNEDEAVAGTSSESSHRSRAAMYKAIVDAAPAYNPTPISQLKSSHIPIPYTPTVPTRSAAVKKSKPSSEYVPHHVGTSRPSYPTYCPTSISSLNSQTSSSSSADPLKNPLYEMYGPEGAQYSPNDVEPIGTGYSYAPENSSYSPYSPEYVPSKVKDNPTYSLQESQLSDDDDVDLAAETAAQLNGDPSGGESLIDLDLSELDNLELDFEENGDDNASMNIDTEENLKPSCDSNKTKVPKEAESSHNSSSSSHKGEKRRSSSVSSGNESKKPKVSHGSSDKNGHSEKSSSSSSSKKSSSSSSHSKKSSSSSSSSKSKSSSSSSSKTSSSKSSSSKTSSSSEAKKSHSSESKSKSSSSSSSSKHKDKHREKEKDKEKDREKDKDRGKDKERGKDKDHSKSKHSKKSSHRSAEERGQQEIQRVKLEEEIRKIEVELDASLEDEDMIEQQCYEMFSEFSETMQNQPALFSTEDQRVTVNDEPAPSATSKKRIAHQASHSSSQPSAKPVPTLAKKSSPYQVMRDRWEMLKKEKMQSLELKASLAVAPASVPRPSAPAPYSSTNAPQASLPTSTSAPAKKKIAGVSNVAMLLKPPTTLKTSSTPKATGTSPSRFYDKTSQRVDEYGRLVKVRVAHAPNMDAPAMRKPIVNPSDCRKFKVATRQANVNKLFQAYIDAGFGEASHDMALESEKSSTQGTESLGVYSHRIIQTLKDLRACAESSQNGPKMEGMSGIPNRVVSHNAMIAGKLGSRVSWSIQSGKKETEPKPHLNLYEQMKPYILTKEQLEENGFPMPSSEKGVATMKPSSFRVIHQPSDPRQKICVRCLKPYSVNKHGEQVKDEECFYHWGRKFKRFREAETKYTCCDGTGSGCSIAPYHVFEQNWDKNSGYMSTLSKPHMESNPGIYALDCEMCYTTAGIELTRVTVIKEDLSVAYETLVKPANKILDYNTRFSGITEEDLKGVTTSILQVQATLLGMFCDKTILVGHSLESDLKALKLIHPTVVDSSVVFPHKMGPPKKRALRNLAGEYLKKIIQNDVGGHDSKEDAVAALELILWKLKEDQKTR